MPSPCRVGLPATMIFLFGLVATAQEASDVATHHPATSEHLQQIYVPSDDPASWPAGDWIPVSHQDLLNLSNRPDRTGPASASLEKAIYRARISGTALVGGTLEAITRLRSEEPQFVDLGRSTLAISRLHWSGRQAIWGLAEDERSLLHVEQDGATLSGRWSLAGRRVFSNIEFDVRVPPATVSQLELELPANRDLTLDSGLISSVADSDQSNWKIWTIDLGRRTSCRLTVVPAASSNRNALRELQVTQFTTYSFVDSDLRIQTDITIQRAAGDFDTLEIVAPPDMTFSSVTTGNETVLPAWRQQEEQRSLLVIDVSGISLQADTRLRLRSQLPLRAGSRQGLPRLGLVGGRWLQLRRQVRVVSPLQLKDLEMTGSRLVNASMGTDSGAALEFDDLAPAARIRVTVDTPDPELSASVLSRVDWQQSDPQLRTELEIEAQTGSTYSLVCNVPTEWEVTRVDAGSAMPVAQWRTAWDADSGSNRLYVELRNALSPQSPLQITVLARPRTGLVGESADVPVILPLVSGQRDVAVVIAAPAGIQFESPPDSDYRLSNLADLVAAHPELGEEFTEIDDSALLVLEAANPGDQQWLTLRAPNAGPTAPVESDSISDVSDGDTAHSADVSSLEEPIRASMQVVTLVAVERGPFCRNRVMLRIPPATRPRTMRVRFPEMVRLLSAESSLPLQVTDREVLVDIPSADGPAELTMSYQSPLYHSLLSGQARIPLPRWNGEPTNIGWQIDMPHEFRIRPPTDGSTALASPHLSWSQRILGPLGRPLGGELFWPFSPSAWRSLILDDTRFESTSTDRLQQFHRSLAGQHAALTLSFWNVASARQLGWVVLLISLLVTSWPFQYERLLRPGWTLRLVLIGIAGALLSPELLAIPWGGFVVGATLGALLPERWRVPRLRVASERSAPQSRTILPLSATMGALLAGCLIRPAPSVGWQETAAPPGGNAPIASMESSEPLKVLIPLPPEQPDSAELPTYVYVDRSAAQRILGRDVPSAPHYLLRSADYDIESLTAPRPSITARFDVVLLKPASETRIVLSLTGVQFPDAQLCKVDGIPASLLPHRSGDGIVVVVPARTATEDGQLAQVQVELVCEPRPSSDEQGPRLNLGIPSILASQLTIQASEGSPTSIRVVHGGSLTQPSADRPWRVALGGQGHLSVHLAESTTVQRWLVPVSSGSVIEAHPMRVRIDSRLTFLARPEWSRLDGQSLQLQLPGGSIVHEVRGAGLQHWQSSRNGRNPVLLDLLFTADTPPELAVEISFDLPASQPESGRGVLLPALSFLTAATEAEFPVHRMGVAAAPGFRLSSADPEGMIPGTTGIDETLLPAWRGPRTVRTADATYQLTSARSLSIPLEPIVPSVSTSIQQTVTVQPSTVEWSALLQVTIRDAPLALHRVKIDPRVNLRQVSVFQESVDRLASWSRTAPDQLVLFLKEELSGAQTVQMQGSLAVDDRSDFVIPSLSVDGASLTEPPEVVVQHAAQIPTVVAAEDGTVVAADPLPATMKGIVELATLNLDPTLPPLRIQRQRGEQGLNIEQLTVIEALQDGEAHWTRLIRIDTSQVSQETVTLDVAAAPPQIQLAASVPATEEIGENATRLILNVAAADSDMFDVTIAGRSPLPAGVLPDVRSAGAPLTDHLVVILEDVDVSVDGGIPLQDRDGLSEWTRESLALLERPVHRIFRMADGPVQLSPPADASSDAWLQRFDAAVWRQPDGRHVGVSVAEITALQPTQIAFTLPDGMTLQYAQLDGGDVSPIGAATYNLPASQMPQRLVLWWSVESPTEAGLSLPTPRNLAGAAARAVVFGDDRQIYLFDDAVGSISPLQLWENGPSLEGSAALDSPIWQALRDAGVDPRLPVEAVSDRATHAVRLPAERHTISMYSIDRQLAGVIGLLLAAGVLLVLWFAVGPWSERLSEIARVVTGLPGLGLLGATVWLLGTSWLGFMLLVLVIGVWLTEYRRRDTSRENNSRLQSAG